MKLGMISLGCAKNAVDSETILSFFKRNDFNIVLKVAKKWEPFIDCLKTLLLSCLGER